MWTRLNSKFFIISIISSSNSTNSLTEDGHFTVLKPKTDRKRKSITKVFKECGLSITCEVNKKIVDFLDVRFNLNDQTYEPYRKPNNNPVYINKHSNHPPNIINEVPKAISKRLTSISCNKNSFDQTLTYDEQDKPASDSVNKENNQTRKRKQNIIWYNPPYSMNVKTNVGKIFFKLLQQHFPHSLTLCNHI